MSSAPATEPVTADQTAAPAPAADAPPKTNEQKAKDFAEKHGLLDKIKKMFKKRALKAATAAAH